MSTSKEDPESSVKKIILKSVDSRTFEIEIEEAVAFESKTIKNSINDGTEIPILNVAGRILDKVIEYLKKHVEFAVAQEDELKKWDAAFVDVDQDTLLDLMLAAKCLDIKSLLDLTCKTWKEMILEKKPDEICNKLNSKNEKGYSTDEEDKFLRDEEEIRGQCQHIF